MAAKIQNAYSISEDGNSSEWGFSLKYFGSILEGSTWRGLELFKRRFVQFSFVRNGSATMGAKKAPRP